MLIKDNIIKTKQNKWTDFSKDKEKKLIFLKKCNNNPINILKIIDNNNKMFQNKISNSLIYDKDSSSSINPNSKIQNSLSLNPINLKSSIINKNNNKIYKSQLDSVKIPKTNLNYSRNDRIAFDILKMNTNKNKENKSINYIFHSYNLSSKNMNSGLFKKKILNKKIGACSNYHSNSMSLIKNDKVLNSYSNIDDRNNNSNDNINKVKVKNNKYEIAQKEKERLDILYNEEIIESQKINYKIKELENNNKILKHKIDKIKNENLYYESTLNKIIKIIKILKKIGFDTNTIMNNLSAYDIEENNEADEKREENIECIDINEECLFKNGDELVESKQINNIDKNESIYIMKKIKEYNLPKIYIKKKEMKISEDN